MTLSAPSLIFLRDIQCWSLGIMSKRIRACWGFSTGVESTTEVMTVPLGGRAKWGQKKGETAFPPSRSSFRNYFYFCVLLFLLRWSKQRQFWIRYCLEGPKKSLGQSPNWPSAIAFGLRIIRKKGKMKGRYLPPSRSISDFVIFIAAAVIFIGLLHIKLQISCQIKLIDINQ